MTPIPSATPDFVPFPKVIAAHPAEMAAGAIAFQMDECAMNWKTLHERTTQVALALRKGGIGPGDHVAIIGHSSLAYIECFFGAVAARACVVPLPASASVGALES